MEFTTLTDARTEINNSGIVEWFDEYELDDIAVYFYTHSEEGNFPTLLGRYLKENKKDPNDYGLRESTFVNEEITDFFRPVVAYEWK